MRIMCRPTFEACCEYCWRHFNVYGRRRWRPAYNGPLYIQKAVNIWSQNWDPDLRSLLCLNQWRWNLSISASMFTNVIWRYNSACSERDLAGQIHYPGFYPSSLLTPKCPEEIYVPHLWDYDNETMDIFKLCHPWIMDMDPLRDSSWQPLCAWQHRRPGSANPLRLWNQVPGMRHTHGASESGSYTRNH
jgi:hypothetical protein